MTEANEDVIAKIRLAMCEHLLVQAGSIDERINAVIQLAAATVVSAPGPLTENITFGIHVFISALQDLAPQIQIGWVEESKLRAKGEIH